jgi:hypothetical protein
MFDTTNLTARFGEARVVEMLGVLRSPRLGYHVGADVSDARPRAAVRADLRDAGFVDAAGGLTEYGVRVSCILRS